MPRTIVGMKKLRRHRMLLLALAALLPYALSAPSRPAVKSGKSEKPKRSKPPVPLHIDAIAISEPGVRLQPFTYEEVGPLPKDSIEVVVHASCLTAGDVQQCRGEWGPCLMPLVPGREAVGVVVKVGEGVKGLAPGDRVAVLLGTGLDSEADDDGADRSTLDQLTTGAAARRLRVPVRWAFALPLALPSGQAAGLLGAGGAVWSQLTSRKLAKGTKIGVLGNGAVATLTTLIAEILELKPFAISDGSAASVPTTAPMEAVVDVTDAEHLRLHTGSFAALVVATSSPTLELGPYLALISRGGALLVASTPTASVSISPRVLQERRLSVLAPPPLAPKAVLAMLSACAEHGIAWPSEELSFDATGASAAFTALETAPGIRAVLLEPVEHAKWLKRAKRLRAAGGAKAGAGAGAGAAAAVGSAAAAASAASAASLNSVFSVFSKVREMWEIERALARSCVSALDP